MEKVVYYDSTIQADAFENYLKPKGIVLKPIPENFEHLFLELNQFLFIFTLDSYELYQKEISEKSILIYSDPMEKPIKSDKIIGYLSRHSSPEMIAVQIESSFEIFNLEKNYKKVTLLNQDSESKVEELQKIAISLSTEKDIDSLLKIIIKLCIQITSADAGTIYLIEENKTEKVLKFVLNENCSLKIESVPFTLPLDKKSIAGYVAVSRQILNIPDSYKIGDNVEYTHSKKFDEEYSYYTKSILTFPMANHEDKVIGVIQLVNKRVHPDICLCKKTDFENWVIPFTPEDEKFVYALASQAAVALENAYLYKNLENLVIQRTAELKAANEDLALKNKIIEDDLKMAKQIQKNILPVHFSKIKEFKFDIYYNPMSEIGGDIYDIFEIEPGKIRVFSADATGHGVQAALMTMLIKAEYEQIKMHKKMPGELLSILNVQLSVLYSYLQVFLPTVILDIDLNQKKLFYGSASHPSIYLTQGDEVLSLNSTNMILGVMEDMKYETREMELKTPFKLLIYSDGLFEEFNEQEEEYGTERVLDMFTKNKTEPVSKIIELILKDLKAFLGNIELRDDLTMVAIETAD